MLRTRFVEKREQHLGVGWLHKVVIESSHFGQYLVRTFRVLPGNADEHGALSRDLLAYLPCNVPAVPYGQTNVEQYHVRVELAHAVVDLGAVVAGLGFVAFQAKQRHRRQNDVAVIVHHKHTGHTAQSTLPYKERLSGIAPHKRVGECWPVISRYNQHCFRQGTALAPNPEGQGAWQQIDLFTGDDDGS